jgi:hypothetical protein
MKVNLLIWLSDIFILLFIFPGNHSFAQPKSLTYPVIIDHTSAKKFDTIPSGYLTKAANIKVMFRHASVGVTINNGLDCIQGTRTNPSECNTYPDYKYDRRNWSFQLRGNSGWFGKINDFVTQTNVKIDSFDVFSFKYCYLDGLDGIAEPCGGTFNPALVKKAWDSLRINMERLEKKHPDKFFIWWTIPLTQSGQHCTDSLNFLIRKYAVDNNQILFDIADIEAWDTSGNHLLNSNGWEVAYSVYCGEKPPGPSCHPNWPGSIIMGKAFWWMMACVAGMKDTITTYSPQIPYKSLYIYPNPATDQVFLSFYTQKIFCCDIRIFDVFGKQIIDLNRKKCFQPGFNQVKLSTSGLKNGSYYLMISGESFNDTKHFLVIH